MTTTRKARTFWLAAGSIFAVVTLAVAAFNMVDALAQRDETFTQRYEGVSRVDLTMTSADVRIVATASPHVTVTAEVRHGLWAFEQDWGAEGDLLTVRGGCRFLGPLGDCRIRYLVEVPDTVDVTVRNSFGNIVLADLSGRVTISTTSGDITAERLTGPAEFHNRFGDITATALRSPGVEATATSGDVRLAFAAEPETVDVTARHGSVDIVLPDTSATYRVDLSSEHGDTRSSVPSDPESARTVTATVENGDVTVRHP